MANLNRCWFIGRLTRDPEHRTFSTGGAVASMGLALNSRRKNATTGQWEDAPPTFITLKAYNRGKLLQADTMHKTLKKGSQIFVEGHYAEESWNDKNTGEKRSRPVFIVDNFQYLDPKPGTVPATAAAPAASAATNGTPTTNEETLAGSYAANGQQDDDSSDIPF